MSTFKPLNTLSRPLSLRNGVTRNATIVGVSLAALATVALFLQSLFPTNGPASATIETEPQDFPAPLPVNTIQVLYESGVTQTQSYTGTIRAKQSSDLAFELPGTITEVLVREGDTVKPNQVLAKLDTRLLLARQAATQAQLDQANALLDELEAGPREERIRSATEQVKARESDFRLAALNRERRQRLHAAGAISDEEFDQARFAVQAAQANLLAAKEQLSELETGTRKEQLAAQTSAVRQLESALNEIQVSLEKSLLLAPFAGTISRRYADEGSIASASVPIVRLIESGALEAIIGLPIDAAANLPSYDSSSKVTLHLGEREIRAAIRSRIREIDPVTRTQNFLLDIDPLDTEQVVPGELCEWKIEQVVNRSGFWLPSSSLTRGIRGLWSVMAVVDHDGQLIAEKRDIEIVLTESDRVLARGTLSSGDQVIVDGLHRIAAGQRIVAVNDFQDFPED